MWRSSATGAGHATSIRQTQSVDWNVKTFEWPMSLERMLAEEERGGDGERPMRLVGE
jgi:hypothetical protein